jgi:hypothetical protein
MFFGGVKVTFPWWKALSKVRNIWGVNRMIADYI